MMGLWVRSTASLISAGLSVTRGLLRAGIDFVFPFVKSLRPGSAAELLAIHGLKPGWARIGFHYTHDDDEVDFLIRAVEFVADYGARFLPLYAFEVETGAWTLREDRAPDVALSIADVLAGGLVA